MSHAHTDDEVAQLFAATNPTRSDGSDNVQIEFTPMATSQDDPKPLDLSETADEPRAPWALVTGVAAAVALVVSLVVTTIRDVDQPAPADQPASSTTPRTPDSAARSSAETDAAEAGGSSSNDTTAVQLAIATAYWEALEAGDETGVSSLTNSALPDPDAALPDSRAQTLEGRFDWYETVGWHWNLTECEIGDSEKIECSATARNAWSEAMGVEPIAGTFIVRFGDDGITALHDEYGKWQSQWSQAVYRPFRAWVSEHHPADARVMFDFTVDVNPEILSLYAINTERFVDAQQEPTPERVVSE
ncbi:hypothetical protein [Ilumatobacter nonamiensis]|uniref:hypothetical protein n=1 Tax=Ilumatobacter nonamiensis TaxID=467093 RepID=UPI00034DD1E3|nr:hypothetical protein [Ilumatobacter nonamiensis]